MNSNSWQSCQAVSDPKSVFPNAVAPFVLTVSVVITICRKIAMHREPGE